MKVEGNCHCGAIAYEGEADVGAIGVCHCADCQALTGSAFRANVQVPAASFRLLRGEPRIYIKTADSGARRAHPFCGDCGSPIYARAEIEPPAHSLPPGALNPPHHPGPPSPPIWTSPRPPGASGPDGAAARE